MSGARPRLRLRLLSTPEADSPIDDTLVDTLKSGVEQSNLGCGDFATTQGDDHVDRGNSEVVQEPPQKKSRGLMIAEDNTVNFLKSKIENLKKKPADFDPSSVAWWDVGESVPFLFFCLAFDVVSCQKTSITVKTYILCNMLGTVMKTRPDDLAAVMYLLQNKVASAHEGIDLRPIEKATIIMALADAYAVSEAHVRHQYKMKGDFGLVAKECLSSQTLAREPAALTIAEVFGTLRTIAKGPHRVTEYTEKELIMTLLVAAIDSELQYLICLLQCKLRIGIAEHNLLAALGRAAMYHENHSKPPPDIPSPLEEEAAKVVKQVYCVIPFYDKVIAALLLNGLWNLTNTCSLTIGVPVQLMPVKPISGVSEVVKKFRHLAYTCEYKYDGERAQIHFMEDGSVMIYNCKGGRITAKYPDVCAAVLRSKKQPVTSFVLDCVIVAYDRAGNRNMPSQQIPRSEARNYEVCIYAFDIMFYNGQSLIKEQLQLRRQCLYQSFEEEPGYFQFARSIISNNPEEIQMFLEAAVDDGCEGLIIKPLNTEATYEPSKRSDAWLKLRKDHMNGFGVTLNLVPIGAFNGRGTRAGVYGSFLLACYNPNKDEFQSICITGFGFKEVVLAERCAIMRSTVIPNPKSNYRYGELINPDVWFDTTEVWEVTGAGLTINPAYQAAVGVFDPVKGISLRFSRVSRILEDCNPRQATSSLQVADMYNARIQNHNGNEEED